MQCRSLFFGCYLGIIFFQSTCLMLLKQPVFQGVWILSCRNCLPVYTLHIVVAWTKTTFPVALQGIVLNSHLADIKKSKNVANLQDQITSHKVGVEDLTLNMNKTQCQLCKRLAWPITPYSSGKGYHLWMSSQLWVSQKPFSCIRSFSARWR